MLVACRQVGIEPREAVVGQLGLGAAGFGIASLMVDAGARRVLAYDPGEASHERARAYGIEISDMETVMREADVVVATTGRPGLIEPAMVRTGQVILALTNPDAEIAPSAALAAGAAFAADGSLVNNVLGYPGIFRGALDVGAREINLQMKLAAADAIAGLTAKSELVPDVLDPAVHERVAEAVRSAAVSSGAAEAERPREPV
jgi:malate dehydrogenase (oxaloacetate-decarboxylating)